MFTKFNTYVASIHFVGYGSRCSRPEKRIKNKIPWVRNKFKATFYKAFWFFTFLKFNAALVSNAFPCDIFPNIS